MKVSEYYLDISPSITNVSFLAQIVWDVWHHVHDVLLSPLSHPNLERCLVVACLSEAICGSFWGSEKTFGIKKNFCIMDIYRTGVMNIRCGKWNEYFTIDINKAFLFWLSLCDTCGDITYDVLRSPLSDQNLERCLVVACFSEAMWALVTLLQVLLGRWKDVWHKEKHLCNRYLPYFPD